LENQLELLKRLQKIDSTIKEIENIKHNSPIKIKQLEKELEQKRQGLEKEKAVLEEIQKERRKKEQQLGIEMERLRKSQDKLDSVKTNKEYQAVLKEIDDIKRTSSDLETEILIFMEKADEVNKEIKEKENKYQEWVQEFENQKKSIQTEIEKCEEELKNQQKFRQETIKNIHPDLIKRYEMLLKRRQGVAVVPIRDGLCQGCNMNIPPQKFLEIRKNNNAIMSCPFCNRILYFEESSSEKGEGS